MSEDWTPFYVTCIHCIQEYVDKGLVAFNDHVLNDRQLLAAAAHDEPCFRRVAAHWALLIQVLAAHTLTFLKAASLLVASRLFHADNIQLLG